MDSIERAKGTHQLDSQRFDDLTRALAKGASRRGLLKGLVAGVAGGLGDLGGGGQANALTPRPAGSTCMRQTDCASGICDSRTRRCACAWGDRLQWDVPHARRVRHRPEALRWLRQTLPANRERGQHLYQWHLRDHL